MAWTVKEKFNELLKLEECPRIEAKRSSEIGKSIMQTICAYSNEPGLGGGWILLGVSEPDQSHDSHWIEGIKNVDNLLGELSNNCRNQFEHPIAFESKHEEVEGKLVIGIFVPELNPSAKPCRFIGKYNKSTKRKTGVWRRGANGDYECTEKELEPLLIARLGISYENIIPSGITVSDLDSDAIDLYRRLRAKVRPTAEELQSDNNGLLQALNLITPSHTDFIPNLAGLLLMGKPLSLRRLVPAIRVDYVRIQGNEWVENPEQRFTTTLDLRDCIIRLITKLEIAILDDMPYHFRLEEGQTQRSDQPLLPQKVVREAIVNALMHRDYHINQPILIVRYRNRLEIQNPGYSLKPLSESENMGSRLRNPIIAAALYDLNFAETKGSGMRTMSRLLENAGLTKPVFASDRENNQFTATFLLHQLMDEEQLKWLEQFNELHLTDDEAKALVLIKEIRAIDNAGLRAVTNLDTLSASQVLRRLCQDHLLIEKGGRGPASYYKPSSKLIAKISSHNLSDELESHANRGDLASNRGDFKSNRGDLEINRGDLPGELAEEINNLSPKARKHQVWRVILKILSGAPYSAEGLSQVLGREMKSLKSSHLSPMRKKGLINYLYPEVINHPEQAYVITDEGKKYIG